MSTHTTTLEGYDSMAEAIERAIGPNDPYPTATQLAAHLAKQALKERHFNTQDTRKEAP
jgi:hypothetical protein